MAVMLCVALLAGAHSARADAMPRTNAMQADTIAEVFVEERGVRLELEIGAADLEGFDQILPQELHERAGLGGTPLADRLPAFFRSGLTLRPGGGQPLVRTLAGGELGRRVVRDEISGAPLAVQPEDAPRVLRVRFEYALSGRPEKLVITPPLDADGRVRASIGFVAYHAGLPTNDFAYLPRDATLELDWEDPWYSRFERRQLGRALAEPVLVILRVDAFEVRKEVIVRPRDLQHWVDLGLADRDVVPAAEWNTVLERASAFLRDGSPVTIDGRPVQGVVEQARFVERGLRTTGVLDEPHDLPLLSAMLGVTITCPVEVLPESATVRWELFSPRVPRVSAIAFDEAGGLPSEITAEDPLLEWRNFLTSPRGRNLVEVPLPPAPPSIPVPVVSLAVGAVLGFVTLRSWRAERKRRAAVLAGVTVVAVLVVLPARVRLPAGGAPDALSEEEATAVTGALLDNVYRALDRRDESLAYDTLARSVAGDVLEETYVETRAALELRDQGGARISVKDVVAAAREVEPLEDRPGFTTRCEWILTGSVLHWGHLHSRRSFYDARLTLEPVADTWKITSMEVLAKERR